MPTSLTPPAPWLAWLLFVALLLGQLGAGLAASLVTGEADDCCPSEQASGVMVDGAAEAPSGMMADAEADAEADAPTDGEAEHDLCPPGCDHCTCCAPALAVLTLWSNSFVHPTPSDAFGLQPPGDVGAGASPRIYRPPQPALG